MDSELIYPEKWEDLNFAPQFLQRTIPFNIISLFDENQKKLNKGTIQVIPKPKHLEIEIKHLSSILFREDDFLLISEWLERNIKIKVPAFSKKIKSDIQTYYFTNNDSFLSALLLLTQPNAKILGYTLREFFELKELPDFPYSNFIDLNPPISFSISLDLNSRGNFIRIDFDQHIFRMYGSKEPTIKGLDLYIESYLRENQYMYSQIDSCEMEIVSLSQFLKLSDVLRESK